jgi:hypothetical protein
MATHATSSLECAIVGYDFYFTKYWCTTWGIYVLGNADGLRIFGSAQNNNLLKDPMFLLFGMGFHSIYKKINHSCKLCSWCYVLHCTIQLIFVYVFV